MVVKNPVGRPPSPKVTPQGLIEDVEQLKNHRARTIRSILSLQRELGYDGRQRRAQGTGTVFTSAGQRSSHALLGGFVEISTAGKRRRKKIRGKTKEEVERKMQPHMTGDAVDSEAENLRRLGARSITQLERNLQELWRA